MSGRHQPEHGADSACVTCQGRGSMITDAGPVSCPSCHGQELCGSCGYMTPMAQLDVMDNGRYRWFRCHDCREKANARWAAEVAADARWREEAYTPTFEEWLDGKPA